MLFRVVVTSRGKDNESDNDDGDTTLTMVILAHEMSKF